MQVLVTGGAGYIGSHTCLELLERGWEVVVIDNLRNSNPESLERVRALTGKSIRFYEGDVRDEALLKKIFEENKIGCVIHFAGLKAVGESVAMPWEYYDNNLNSTLVLVKVMKEAGVKKLIFSSSATVYTGDNEMPLRETSRTGNCTNPYGWTKYMTEQILQGIAHADPEWSICLLRYFNPIGAHESGMIGEDPRGIPNNLMPYITQVAVGRREKLSVFGNDYDTPDGTGVRDYIHVVDLAKGHVAAVCYAGENRGCEVFNLGTGVGYSVLDMVHTFIDVNRVPVPYEIGPRRPGDLATCYADPAKSAEKLGWKAEKTLADMCRDAWNWQSKNPMGYESKQGESAMLITAPEKLVRFYARHRVWQGIPGIAHTPGGKTYISFYSGGVEENYGNFAAVIRSEDGEYYSEPIAVAFQEGEYRCFDPVLWMDPLGRLWFIWNVMPGEQVMAAICEDPDADTPVWGEEFCVGRGIMMNKPLVLSSGEWLFPIAIWKTDIYYDMRKSGLTPEDIPGSYVYRTADHGKTFTKLGGADVPERSFDEHMVLERKDGTLRMLVRLKKGIGESESADGGRTWSAGIRSELDGPSSRFFIRKLPSGRVLLINHHNFTGRNNLTAFLSEDDGETFPYSLLLDERRGVSYPDAQLCGDGFIRIVYDHMRGCFKSSLEEVYTFPREILVAKITEEDILRGNLVTEGSALKQVVCKLGMLAPEDGDPFEKKR